MRMLAIADVAKEIGWSRQQVIRAIEAGELKPLILGSKRMVDLEEAQALASRVRDEGIGIEAVSSLTGLTVGAIRAGIAEGWIPCWRKGRAWRFDGQQVIAAIQKRIEEQNR